MLPDPKFCQITTVAETYGSNFNPAVIQTFLGSMQHRTSFSAHLSTKIEDTVYGAIQSLIACVKQHPISSYQIGDVTYITFPDDHGNPELLISAGINDRKPFSRERRQSSISFFGEPKRVEAAYTAISERHKLEEQPEVSWYCLNQNRLDYFNVECAPPSPYTDEFYPWIKGGVKDYYKRFVESDSNILLCYGDPGTGKTSFIRNFMWEHNLSTMLTYDQELFQHDPFFITFLNGTSSLLVVEDADTLLLSREDERNHVMSKLLNASDGLIKIPNKKIILTANITNMSKIDSALLRPGRCFDIMEFRRMTMVEAQAAADSVGITVPIRQEGYTLAELFDYMTPVTAQSKSRVRMGFA